jgi:hypothetical protein
VVTSAAAAFEGDPDDPAGCDDVGSSIGDLLCVVEGFPLATSHGGAAFLAVTAGRVVKSTYVMVLCPVRLLRAEAGRKPRVPRGVGRPAFPSANHDVA